MSRPVLVSAFVLLLACPAFSQSRAVLRSNGAVKVNGNGAGYSNVIMDGDHIVTDEHSSAFLLLPGKMITLGPGSSVLFQNGSVIPGAGAAKITTATCEGLNCATSSTKFGSGSAKDTCDDDRGDDCHRGKKCVSPKKPDHDHDRDHDRNSDHDRDRDHDCDDD
jgi:hypothetical protein